jgi:hypothetical protein
MRNAQKRGATHGQFTISARLGPVKWRSAISAAAVASSIVAGLGSAALAGRVERLTVSDNALAVRIGPNGSEIGPGWSGHMDARPSSNKDVHCRGVNLDTSVTVTGRAEGRFDGPRYDLDATIEILKTTAQVRTEWTETVNRAAYPACLGQVFQTAANSFRKIVQVTSAREIATASVGDRSRVVEVQYTNFENKTKRVLVSGYTSVGRAEFSALIVASAADRRAIRSTVLRAERRFAIRGSRAVELRR